MNKGQKIWKWDLEKRIQFQALLQQGYSLPAIRSIWQENNIYPESPSLPALSKEVRLGLTEEQADMKRYVKYDVVRVYSNLLGNETFKWLVKQVKKMDQE